MASAQLLPTKASLRAVSDEAMWSLVPSFLAIIAPNHSPWQTLRGGGLTNSSMHLQNGWTDGCTDSYPFGHFWFHWFSLINFHFKEIQRLDGLTFRWNKPNPKHQHRKTHYNWLKTFLTQLQTTNRLTLLRGLWYTGCFNEVIDWKTKHLSEVLSHQSSVSAPQHCFSKSLVPNWR